jgi:two-component system, sensor histidine kinase and response regulator
LRNGKFVTDPTETTADLVKRELAKDKPMNEAPAQTETDSPAASEDADDQPFDLRASIVRMRAQVRAVMETMTVPQFAMGLGALLMGLGLVLLPPPVTIGHLILGVGSIMLLLAVIWGSPPGMIHSATQSAAQEPAMERVVGIVEGIERKIEHLKDTQWELSESEFRYRDLLDAQDDVILRRDAAGRLTFVNRAFSRVFGVEGAGILGQPFRPIVHEGECPESATFEHDPRRTYTQRIETAHGARWFAWEEQVIPAAEGHARQYQCIGRDTTAERQAQAALAEARDAAQAASRAKSRFLAVMSHEIRTPMNGILGMTSLLEETELTPEQETYTRAVGQSAKTLLGIIDEILDFSKIEAGKLDLRQSSFTLDEAVQGVVELLAPRAHEKGLEIAWTIAPSLPRVVVGDDTRLRQILMNLIGNAIKFTDRGGITIAVDTATATPPGSECVPLEILVTDTGIGIAPSALANIFNEFEQADPSTTRRHAGTGLGLAISRHLAEAMGGDISAQSQLGAGSTFTLRLVLGQSRQSGTIGQALEPLRSAKRVLLVLDGQIEARALATTLQAQGSVVGVGCLADAEKLVQHAAARQQPFDVLMVGAGIDGREAGRILAQMRLAHAGTEQGTTARAAGVRGIVAIKAGERDHLKMFRAEGFAGYLVRPVRAASLLAQIGLGAGASLPTVPVRPAIANQTLTGSSAAPRAWRPNVLLAEDNEIGALLACAMLDKSGCDVTHARNGADAIDAFQHSVSAPGARAFDLILMDMHMPVIDGLEATRRVRALQRELDRPARVGEDRIPSPPIVALTANAFSEDRAQCLEAGMVDYLAKPFVKAELMAIIEKWCRPAHLGRGHGAIEEDAA